MTNPSEKQDALDGMGSYRIKFGGLGHLDEVDQDDLPEMDDIVIYTVTTKCNETGHKRMKDGELRTLRGMEVVSVVPQGPPKKPDPKPAPPALFPVAGDRDGDGKGGD